MTDSRVSVVIPCHDERRWPGLVAAVSSVAAQTLRPAEIIVVVDHNEALYEHAHRELAGVTVLRNQYHKGVSGNRNTGAFHATSPIVAFVDDDVVAPPDWLAGLVEPFVDPRVVGTGGGLTPYWQRQPRWVPEEFLWAYGASYHGMPTTNAVVRNVWSGNMAVRRDAFCAVGGFRVGFGKVGRRARPEDTELCLRMARARGGHWVYVPGSALAHRVPAEHATVSYFLARCFTEGRGKIEMSRLGHRREGLESERRYVRQLPLAAGRRLINGVLGRERHGVAKALAVVAGLSAAGLGAALELAHGDASTSRRA